MRPSSHLFSLDARDLKRLSFVSTVCTPPNSLTAILCFIPAASPSGDLLGKGVRVSSFDPSFHKKPFLDNRTAAFVAFVAFSPPGRPYPTPSFAL
jgi:hypothetical protein